MGILSRGYRGSGGTSDEIEMLKGRLGDRVVFGVGPDRYIAGRRIESEHQIDVFLLDDGFQHLQLARDVDIVLVDSTIPHSEGWFLPAGSMREPLSALRRASAVILTRLQDANTGSALIEAIQQLAGLPTFSAQTTLLGCRRVSDSPDAQVAGDEFPSQPVFAFCGIGNPAAFFGDVKRWGMIVVGQKMFRDHHFYTARDVGMLEDHAQQAGAKALLTTEKDMQNLKGLHFSRVPLYCCRIALEIRDDKRLCALLSEKLSSRAGFVA